MGIRQSKEGTRAKRRALKARAAPVREGSAKRMKLVLAASGSRTAARGRLDRDPRLVDFATSTLPDVSETEASEVLLRALAVGRHSAQDLRVAIEDPAKRSHACMLCFVRTEMVRLAQEIARNAPKAQDRPPSPLYGKRGKGGSKSGGTNPCVLRPEGGKKLGSHRSQR